MTTTTTTKRIRPPDYDLQSYLQNNNDIFTVDEIETVRAEITGHHDGDAWFWIIKLKGRANKEERFVLTRAWCDYSGWDCQSGGKSVYAATARKAAMHAPEEEDGRHVQWNLREQLRGKQPFGLETRQGGGGSDPWGRE